MSRCVFGGEENRVHRAVLQDGFQALALRKGKRAAKLFRRSVEGLNA